MSNKEVIKTQKVPHKVIMAYEISRGYFGMGYSFSLITKKLDGSVFKKTVSGFLETKNRRRAILEILLEALRSLKLSKERPIVFIFLNPDPITSSNINRNMFSWEKNDWKTSKGKVPVDVELYKRIREYVVPGVLFLHSDYKQKRAKEFSINRLELKYFSSLESGTINYNILLEYNKSKKRA